jgi:hypothetical protein
MNRDPQLLRQAAVRERGASRELACFALVLALLLALASTLARPKHVGDIAEYALMTVALADHASPAIGSNDAARAAARLPELRGDRARTRYSAGAWAGSR